MQPSLLFSLMITSVTVAQTAPPGVAELSPVERQKEHFYGAIAGSGSVSVLWKLTPVSSPLDRDIILTLSISNVANPRELLAPPLAEFEEFQRIFSIIELLPRPEPSAVRAEFQYRLRPRSIGRHPIPELKYLYARRVAGRTQFQTVYAETIPLTITKPASKIPDIRPLDGPPQFFELREGSFFRAARPGWFWWFGLFGAATLLGITWVFGWRWLYPDAVRLARIRQNRAVRVAFDQLRKAAKTPDSHATTTIVFRRYLIHRYGLPSNAQTPREITDALLLLKFPPERIADTERLLRQTDAKRFGGERETPGPAEAAAIIERWEGIRR
jgi:hypothetical protein